MAERATRPVRMPDGDLLLLGLLSTLWGASYTFIRLGVATIPPITLIAARTCLAGGALVAVLRYRGLRLPRTARLWRDFFIQACLNSVLPFTLVAWSERWVEASLAAILNSLSPIFAYLLGRGLMRQEAVGRMRLFGVVAGLAGVFLIVGAQALRHVGAQLPAQLALIVASASYGAASLFGRRFQGLDPMMPAAGSMLCGGIILVPASLLFDHPWDLSPSATSIEALLGLALFSTAFAFVVYFTLLGRLGSVATASQAYIRIPIGVAIGMLLLGERPSSTMWIGLPLVVAGVLAITWQRRPIVAARGQ